MTTMQDMMKMNPFIDMMKNSDMNKAFESMTQGMNMFGQLGKNPMHDWSHKITELQQSAAKQVSHYMEHCSEMFMNPMKKHEHSNYDAFKMADMSAAMAKNMQLITHLMQNISESTQGMMKKKAEMVQKQSHDLTNMLKEVMSSTNPENAMAAQAEFAKKSFAKMMSNFKTVADMHEEYGVSSYKTVTKKMNEAFHNFQEMVDADGCCNPRHSAKKSSK